MSGILALEDLIVGLEQSQIDNASAFVVVVMDGPILIHATGPYDQPEQALADAGRQDTDWKSMAGHDDDEFTYHVLPLWGPS